MDKEVSIPASRGAAGLHRPTADGTQDLQIWHTPHACSQVPHACSQVLPIDNNLVRTPNFRGCRRRAVHVNKSMGQMRAPRPSGPEYECAPSGAILPGRQEPLQMRSVPHAALAMPACQFSAAWVQAKPPCQRCQKLVATAPAPATSQAHPPSPLPPSRPACMRGLPQLQRHFPAAEQSKDGQCSQRAHWRCGGRCAPHYAPEPLRGKGAPALKSGPRCSLPCG